GSIGATVTVNGTGFANVTSVAVGGYQQPFTVVSPTQLTLTLGSTARTGLISISAASGFANSSGTFTVVAAAAPTITSFSPSSSAWGNQVTIDGTNLGSVTAVQFNGSTSTLTSPSSDTRIFAWVPNGAT